MGELITEVNRDVLLKLLKGIGWTVKSEMNGYAHKLQDNEKNISTVHLNNECAFIKDKTVDICFYYNDCDIELIDDNCISLGRRGSKSVFINFYGEKQS